MLDKLRRTKERLNKQISLKNIDSKEVLNISREVDKLILEYYKQQKNKI